MVYSGQLLEIPTHEGLNYRNHSHFFVGGGQVNRMPHSTMLVPQIQSPGSRHHSPSRRERKASPRSSTSSNAELRENATFHPPRQVKIHPMSEKSAIQRLLRTPCRPTTPCSRAS